jgi:phenylacetate-CoA ligase
MKPQFPSTAPDALDTVRSTLASLRSVPALADHYCDIVSLDSLEDLIHVPVTGKDQLTAALAHLKPKARHGATWSFRRDCGTGLPELGYAPTGLYMAEVYERWKPLGPADVFVNGWAAGRLWDAHYLMGVYADLAGCTVLGLGAVEQDEVGYWLEFCADRGVTSFGGAPGALRPIFARARELGLKLPALRSVIWLGEEWDPAIDDDLLHVAPDALRWGLFGGAETLVIGTNTPECAADTWHPLPSQLVHVGPDQMLDVTSLKPHGLNPVLRFRTGDAGEWVPCRCGQAGPALRVLGRRMGAVKFRGLLLDVDGLVADVAVQPGVSRVQMVITEHAARGATAEVLVVPSRDAAGDLAARVRRHILGSVIGRACTSFRHDPDALAVRLVDGVINDERTGRAADLVVRRHS